MVDVAEHKPSGALKSRISCTEVSPISPACCYRNADHKCILVLALGGLSLVIIASLDLEYPSDTKFPTIAPLRMFRIAKMTKAHVVSSFVRAHFDDSVNDDIRPSDNPIVDPRSCWVLCSASSREGRCSRRAGTVSSGPQSGRLRVVGGA